MPKNSSTTPAPAERKRETPPPAAAGGSYTEDGELVHRTQIAAPATPEE